MCWIDCRADSAVDAGQGLVHRRLRPKDKRRTFEPANTFEFDAQLRFASNGCLHGVPRSLFVDRKPVVDRKRDMRTVAEGAHRRLDFERGDLIPQPFDLICGLVIGPDVDRQCHRFTSGWNNQIEIRGRLASEIGAP